MVKMRSFSSSDGESYYRKEFRKILSPKTPTKKNLKFDFNFNCKNNINNNTATTSSNIKSNNRIKPPMKKQRSISLTNEIEKVISFKQNCRKRSVSAEISERLARIGDEINEEYAHIFRQLDVAILYNMIQGERRRYSRRNEIRKYVGFALFQLLNHI